MKNLLKISLLSLCILTISTTVIYSNNGVDSLEADKHYQIQTTGIDDETYAVFIFTGSKIYFDLFEFEAGDEFIVTSQDGDFTGTWKAADFLSFTYFTAKVAETVETTTTTSIPEEEETNTHAIQPRADFINIWGFVISLPVPLDSLGFMIGGGAYLGKQSFFLGFAQRDVTGDSEFGSINPDEGKRDDKLTVTITGRNTQFKTGETEVIWGEGITNVGTPDLDSQDPETKLSQQIEIAEDAPLGVTSVTVTYPGGSITGVDKFTVLEQAN